MQRRPGSSPSLRRTRVRAAFDRQVGRERRRLEGGARVTLQRTLIERFLTRNLERIPGPLLEVGPGPGRFTPILLTAGRPAVLLDLSRRMLSAARRNLRALPPRRRAQLWGYVRGAAEGLSMFRDRSFGAVVILGTLGFLGQEGALAVRGAGRVLRHGGLLVVETASATAATAQLFPRAAPAARRLLERPAPYHTWRVFREGYQPYDPVHWAPWEWRFWRPGEIEEVVRRAGFETVERMAVAPMLGNQDRLLSYLSRSSRAWRTLLVLEEEAGHRPECFGLGPVFLLAARRRSGGQPSKGARRDG